MLKSFIKGPKTLLASYNRSLLASPYKTKMATAGFTYFLADCICQDYIEKREANNHCFKRSLKQASVGAFFAAPSLHVWHSLILPKIVKGCTRTFPRVLISVFLNETVLAGYFISFLLFSFEALKTGDIEAGKENVKNKFVPALNTSVRFWTGISFINYGLMPVHLRPVFVSCWSVIWQSYLSYVSNNKVVDMKEILNAEEKEEEMAMPLNMSNLIPRLA